MGFSLSRALQGATMGAAHAAGEIFDDMIKEERKQREAVEAQARAKDLATYQADLIMDRERSRDELKEAREKKDREGLSSQMKEVRSAVREAGLDPDKYDGMKMAAGLADEKGYTSIADKWRTRMETERSHMANEENRKLQIQAIQAQRGANHAAKMDAEDSNAMRSIMRQADRLVIPGARDESGKVIGDPDKDAANAALAWAEDQREQGRSWKSIRSDLAQITDGFMRQPDEMKKAPSINRFSAAVDFWKLPEEEKVKLRNSKPTPAAGGPAPAAEPKKANTGGGIFGWLQRSAASSDQPETINPGGMAGLSGP